MIYAEDRDNNHAFIKLELLSDTEIKYTEEDLLIFARIACGEAQFCDDQEQRIILSVFQNRIKHNKFPNTSIEVARDKRWGIQYASWYDGNANREIIERNCENAKYI